jgi:hypothetical protein
MDIYYFGCINRPGHYLFAPGSRRTIEPSRIGLPWDWAIDSGLCPPGPEIEGHALLHHKGGWTAIAFWDRSVDPRGKCNSGFYALGTLTFEEMVERAKANFPEVWARFHFPVILVGGGQNE